MTFPTVHLNGTSKNDLYEAYSEARHQIRLAIEAVANTCPNGRDYYTQGDQVIYRALEEHEARLKQLEAVYEELGQLLEVVSQ
jgi:hypothetical protein